MTYLMFIHDLDAPTTSGPRRALCWGCPQEHLFRRGAGGGADHSGQSAQMVSGSTIFPPDRCIPSCRSGCSPSSRTSTPTKDSAYAKYMGDAIFKIPTPLMLDQDRHRHGRDLRPGGAAPRRRCPGRHLRIPPRPKSPPPGLTASSHPPAHHPHDGGHDGPPGG